MALDTRNWTPSSKKNFKRKRETRFWKRKTVNVKKRLLPATESDIFKNEKKILIYEQNRHFKNSIS